MASGGGGSSSSTIDNKIVATSLEDTPTWALAIVCFVFISISIIIEYLIHRLVSWLKKNRKNSLFETVEKLKSVLIVLGFMSLILTVTKTYISKICVSTKVANTMLPCRQSSVSSKIKAIEDLAIDMAFGSENKRHLLSDDDDVDEEENTTVDQPYSKANDYCLSKGMNSLISEEGLTQLSIFIFVLAVMQIVYCVLTMALGRAKMRRWKSWEKETQTVEYLAANDPDRFRFTRQTTFARRHISTCSDTPLQLWIKCFFRQFFNSVAKVDYLTLRHGFISAHLATNNYFNFQRYIQRSLDDDFKLVVGISPFMWFLVVIFMLVDVHGWYVFFWVSFIPLAVVLIVGTKLQVIVAKMAMELQHQHSVIKGAPTVTASDNHFWFNRPQYVLTLLHYTLFVNAFELAFFIWVSFQYGINSCYHERTDIIVVRLVLAVTVQVMCSYITLPLYALVTQMGSTLKLSVVNEKTANALKQWHIEVKNRMKKHVNNTKPVIHDVCSSSNTTISSIDLSPKRPTLREITAYQSVITEEDNQVEEDNNSINNNNQIGDADADADDSVGVYREVRFELPVITRL